MKVMIKKITITNNFFLILGYLGTVQKYWRIFCHQSFEEGRHHRPGRGGVLAGREEDIRGGQLHETSILG